MAFAALDPFVESRVDAFEATLVETSQADFRQFLPAPNHEKYQLVLLELMRVDLDLAWSRGERRSAAEYRPLFPEQFERADFRQQLAFEEYRLRCQAGESPDPEDYREQFAIDTSQWRAWQDYDTEVFASEDTRVISKPSDTGQHIPVIGANWKGFHILESLGSGAFSKTFLARQSALAHREVVLKFSRLNHREAWRLAQLQHTHIVPILSVHEYGESSAICMPFLGRTTLADQIRETALVDLQNPSSVDRALEVAMRLADALDHSHQRGVLHRDIKPANILMTDAGEPLLFDFNLAVDGKSRRREEVVGGTLAYMAPEQLLLWQGEDVEVNHQADIYSLGVVIYQLLTGCLPWSMASCCDIPTVLAARSQPITPVSTAVRSATPAVDSILAKCLQSDPADRYQKARHLRDDIRRHLDDLPLAFAQNRSLRESLRKWMRRHPKLASGSTVAILATFICASILTGWLVRESRLRPITAAHALHEFASASEEFRASLVTIGNLPQLADNAIRKGQQIVSHYQLEDPSRIQPQLQRLKPADRILWQENASSLCYLLSDALLIKSRRESGNPQATLLQQSLKYNRLARDAASDFHLHDAIDLQRTRILAAMTPLESESVIRDTDDVAALPQMEMQDSSEESTSRLIPTWVDHLVLGLQARDQHDLPGAERRFRDATRLNPTDAAGWLLVADVLREQAKYEPSIAAYDVAGSLSKEPTSVCFQRGLCRLAQGNYDQAIREFSQFLELHAEISSARLNRALAYMATKQFTEALADLDLAIDQQSPETRAYFLRARVRKALGNLAGAQADVNEGIQRTPRDAASWVARGIARMNSEPRAALADFESALDMNPSDNSARHNQAHVYSEILKEPQHAIDVLTECLRMDPRDSIALAGRGVLLAREGQSKLALQDADKVLKLPLDPVTRYQAACIHALCVPADESHSGKALSLLATSLREDPTIADLLESDPDMKSVHDDVTFGKLESAIAAIRDSESMSEAPSLEQNGE